MVRSSSEERTLVPPDVLDEPEVFQVLDYDGNLIGSVPEIEESKLRRMYETMLLIR